MPPTIGFDFGTTNSTVALAYPDGTVRSASFPLFGRPREAARSILFFDPDNQEFAGHRPQAHAGNPAIEQYGHADGEGRLILSPKSWLAARGFEATSVFGHRFAIEHLVGAVVQHMRDITREQFGVDPVKVVAGRPVHFARGEGSEDDDASGAPSARTSTVPASVETRPLQPQRARRSTSIRPSIVTSPAASGSGGVRSSQPRIAPSTKTTAKTAYSERRMRRGRSSAEATRTNGTGHHPPTPAHAAAAPQTAVRATTVMGRGRRA